MAVDKSPPRILAITVTGIISTCVLIGLKPILDSYYTAMFEAEEYRKVGSVAPAELLALHAAEAKSFAHAPIPLTRAMELVAKGRSEAIPGLKDDGILPQPSTDTGPLLGWAMLPAPASTTTAFTTPAAPPPLAPDAGGAGAAPGAPTAGSGSGAAPAGQPAPPPHDDHAALPGAPAAHP